MTARAAHPRIGTGTCMAHHGELVQGSFPCGSRWVPALVTVPVPTLQARAVFEPEHGEGVRADAGHRKAARAARLTLLWCHHRAAHLATGGHRESDAAGGGHREPDRPSGRYLDPGRPSGGCGVAHVPSGGDGDPSPPGGVPSAPRVPAGGRLRITSPIRPGCGMGSSTADVVASIRAVSSACGVRVGAHEVSRLAHRAETASDPLAHGRAPVLFAQRHGRVHRRWRRPFPPVLLIGCRLPGPPVETLALGAPS